METPPQTSFRGRISTTPFIITWDHTARTMTFRIPPSSPPEVLRVLRTEAREFNRTKPSNIPDYSIHIIEDSDLQTHNGSRLGLARSLHQEAP